MLIQNLAKKKNWLFDLDNTLYSPNLGIFSQIDERMKKFISKKLELSETKSFILQKNFYKKYGTTLYGLMKHYEVDPQEFCDYVFDKLQLDKKLIITDDRYKRPYELDVLKGDSSKLTKATGWTPEYNLFSMVDEMIEFWQEKI